MFSILTVRELGSPEEISRGALSSGTKPATQESADGLQVNEKPIRQCSKSSLRLHRRQERIYEKAIVWVTQARPAAGRVAAVYSHVTRRESSAGRLDIDHRRRPAGS